MEPDQQVGKGLLFGLEYFFSMDGLPSLASQLQNFMGLHPKLHSFRISHSDTFVPGSNGAIISPNEPARMILRISLLISYWEFPNKENKKQKNPELHLHKGDEDNADE